MLVHFKNFCVQVTVQGIQKAIKGCPSLENLISQNFQREFSIDPYYVVGSQEDRSVGALTTA